MASKLGTATEVRLTTLAARMMDAKTRMLSKLQTTELETPLLHLKSLLNTHLQIGNCYWWTEQYEPAHRHWQMALDCGREFLQRYLDSGGSDHPHWEAAYAANTARSASFLGDEATATELFTQAERLAAGLLPGMDRPRDPADTADPHAIYPNVRACALVRLRRLTGFEATTFLRQWPDAATETPEWRQADIHAMLHTSEICMARSRANGREVWADEKAIPPLLRATARYLQTPGPGLQKEAQKALLAFVKSIKDLGHFTTMLAVALDMQTAFPDIFDPILPPARPH